jgi:hypothetical protein
MPRGIIVVVRLFSLLLVLLLVLSLVPVLPPIRAAYLRAYLRDKRCLGEGEVNLAFLHQFAFDLTQASVAVILFLTSVEKLLCEKGLYCNLKSENERNEERNIKIKKNKNNSSYQRLNYVHLILTNAQIFSSCSYQINPGNNEKIKSEYPKRRRLNILLHSNLSLPRDTEFEKLANNVK